MRKEKSDLLSRTTYQISLTILLLFNSVSGQIISQYTETNSGSTPKGIEIWNNTGSSLDFSSNNLVIEKGTNGATPATDYTLSSGTLASGAVIVIGTSDMQTTTENNGATFYLKAFTFNGDDALVVKYGGTITDLFGTSGSDPGSSWSGSGVSTANSNISLKTDITTGDTDGWTDPSTRFETTASGSTLTGFGTAPESSGGVDDPTSLEASVQSSSQIDLSWTDNTDSDNVLLAWNSSSTFGTPTNGQTYSADDAISGGGTVLQYSGTDSYSHTSLTGNTAYYYKVWSYDGSDYSSGATTDATTLKVEPSNHPTSLSASSSYQSIEITWTDAATGSQAPDGYLILGETDATIIDPSDGTAVSDDTDATGNAVAKNITHGSGGSYTFSSLTSSTTWYFEIFAYTNSGTDIDYKTDGTIPTANATTGVAPVFVINEILADPDATNGDANGDGVVSNTDDEFVEIVNRSGYSVDISNWVISDGYSDRHTVTDGTTIGDGVALVVFSGGTPTGISGIVHTASTGALGLNNTSDDVTLKDSEGGTIVTYSYGSTAGDNQSIARNPDYTGDFVKHSTISGNPVLFSPGKTNAGDVSLPVDLSYFTANSTRSDEITLTWVTESEFENLGFLVERRNVDVESSWNEIASYINYSELQGQGSVSHRTEYTFTDNTVEMEQTYDYRLADVSFQGVKEYHEIHVLDVSPITTPSKFLLLQNYPNPFNPTTTIGYDLPQQSAVKLTIHNVQGRQIASIQDEQKPAGSYQVLWNGMNQVGNQVSTGVYFARLQAGDFNQTIKMVYMK